MRDLTDRALDTANGLGAEYADVRIVRRLEESIAVKTGRVEGVAIGETEGFGIRVLVDGAWGFASSNHLELAEADRVAGLAVRIAKASATALRNRVILDGRPAAHGTYETPLTEDPFTVPLETKIDDLVTADRLAAEVKGIAFTESMYAAQREWKTFAATDGSFTEQTITHIGAGVEANAIEGDEHQRRSFPDAGGGFSAAGYEFIRKLDLKGHAEAYAEEAVALLSAPQCEPGRRTIILDPSQLYLQVHESCGHPSELDRVFGTEASYAGTSFLTTDKLDEGFRYGSDQITIVADATAANGMGTFGWDDEGVAAQAVPLVKEGIFVGYLSSRETAPRIGRQSGGHHAIKPFHDRGWSLRRSKQREPGVGLDAGNAGFGERRQIRQPRCAPGAGDGQCADRAGIDVADDARQGRERQIDPAGEQFGGHRRRAAERNVLQVHAGPGLEQLRRQMRGRADAGRGVVQLCR